jgi:hypothetical protein
MDRLELLERLAALSADLTPERGVPSSQLVELRQLLARQLIETPVVHRAAVQPTRPDRIDLGLLSADLRASLEHAIDAAPEPRYPETEEPTTGARVARRTLPFMTTAEADSLPDWAGGRAVDRTLGPFRDRDGRLVWFDVFRPIRQVSIVRAPQTAPFLLVPLRGFLIGASTDYILPAGSIWILSRVLTPSAPAGAYSGLRIKGGRLRLSSAPTVSGLTLTTVASARVTLELELDPAASAPPAASPGKDAIASTVTVSPHVVFVFTAAGGTLRSADDAALKAFGAAFTLARKTGAASFDATINRVLLPFSCEPGDFVVGSSQSPLCTIAGKAPITAAAWALPIAIAPPAQLGAAAGAGALALYTGPGLQSNWRGRKGPLVALGPSIVFAEVNRLAVIAQSAKGPGSTETLRLWKTGSPNAEVRLRFDRTRFRYESLAGTIDALLTTGSLEAATDRPVAVNGRRFSLRSTLSLAVFFDDATTSNVLVEALLQPPPNLEVTALALKNALLTIQPPVLLVLVGRRTAADDEQLQTGTFALFYRLLRFTFTLPDPYVTNQQLPGRFAGRTTELASSAASSLQLISIVQWATPATPQLRFLLLVPGAQGASSPVEPLVASPATAGATTAPGVATPLMFLTIAVPPEVAAKADVHPVNPQQAQEEDRQAIQQLRGLFEETAGRVRESLTLLDVSTNVDQLGVAWGFLLRDAQGPQPFPLQIDDLDVISPGANSRLFMLPQFQWEPLRNLPNPNIGFFPDRLVSADDGGATLFGCNSVRLVPIKPDTVLDNIVAEFNDPLHARAVGARFTLPFGMIATAQLQPHRFLASRWSGLEVIRPKTPTLTGGYQLSVTAHARVTGPTVASPFLPGATWQTRNGVDPNTGLPNGYSVLRGDALNDGAEAFFNNEMGPGKPNRKVPVTRVDFAGYGASTFSKWLNPNAIATASQVRFDVIVGRTAYEVVQIASVLYPWAVHVVRTITIERLRDAKIVRADSGWVATGPGVYDYPDTDPLIVPGPPFGWTEIKTHPGVVKAAYNVRRIRETGRVIKKFLHEEIELLEVRFDADMQIEGVVAGQIPDTDLVPSIDQVGYVQRKPLGHVLMPEDLATIIAEEGAIGGPVNCEIEVADSGQHMHVVRVDVDASVAAPGGIPEMVAAARGSLALPHDGASWSIARRHTNDDQFEPVDPIAGTPLIREGVVGGAAKPYVRFADPKDLLVENAPTLEFGLLQTSDGHQFLLPRPKIGIGATAITTTEVALLADAYARSVSAGLFPKKSGCFTGPAGGELQIVAGGKYRLGPAPTAAFTNIAGGTRDIISGSALAIRAKYAGPINFTLDPGLAKAWSLAVDAVTTSLDIGGFVELMGVKHNYAIAAGDFAKLLNPEQLWAPFLDPVVKILQWLSKLLGVDQIFDVRAVQGSFKFQATAQIPIQGPGNDYIDFGALKLKGKLQAGFGWSENDHWFGFFGVDLGLKVIVLPPIFANGKTAVSLKGTELTGQELKIRALWGASVEAKLGPIGVSAEFNYGIEVIAKESGDWQIGLIVQVTGKADIFIVKVSIKLELMAAIGRAGAKVHALAQAKFSGEVEICWFLTISFEYDIQYEEDLDI